MRADVEDLVDPEVLAMTRRAHDGQVDRQGRNYYHSHLLPIARLLLPYGVDAATAGLLHDVVEDTALTLDDLVEAGVGAAVVRAVGSVTRRADESYDELVGRACADPLGRLVKLADNWHNLTGLDDLAVVDPATAARLRVRYLRARERLSAAVLTAP